MSFSHSLGYLRDYLMPSMAPSARPLPPIALNLAKASPKSTWRREEIYGDDGR